MDALEVGQRGIGIAQRFMALRARLVQHRQVAQVAAALDRDGGAVVFAQRALVLAEAGVGLAAAQVDHALVGGVADRRELGLRVIQHLQRLPVAAA